MSEASQIVILSNNLQLFNLIKKIIPTEYKLDICTDNNELFKQLIRIPENYSAIIISPTQDNMDFLRKVSTCSKIKSIPIILEITNNMSPEEINAYLRAGARYCIPENLTTEITKSIFFAAIGDRKRYLSFERDISAERSALIMSEAIFKFQLLEDCQSLANLIANACPNPKLAVIGIAEILINAVEHGNLGISYVEKTKLQSTYNWSLEMERRANFPENKNKYVTVTFLKNKEHIKLHVKDEGNGFDWNKFQYLDSSRIYDTHGRGIIMAKNLAFDHLEYLNKGNEVNCYINL